MTVTLNMNQKTIAITAVLMASVLAGLFATSPLAYAEDDGRDDGDNGRDDGDNGRDDGDNGRDDGDNSRDNHGDKDKGGDESKTSTDQSIKQKNTGSGDSTNFNCGQNLIQAGVGNQCEEAEEI